MPMIGNVPRGCSEEKYGMFKKMALRFMKIKNRE